MADTALDRWDEFSMGDDGLDLGDNPLIDEESRDPVDYVVSGAVDKLTDPSAARALSWRLLKASLPTKISTSVDTVEDVGSFIADKIEEGNEELKKPIRGLRESVANTATDFMRMFGASEERIQKVDNFLRPEDEGEEYRAPTEAQLQQAEIAASIAAAFQDANKLAVSTTELNLQATERSNAIAQAVGTTSNAHLQSISSATNEVASYHRTVALKVARTALELQFKQYFIGRETRDYIAAFSKDAGSLLTAIKQNTSIPDYNKARVSEVYFQTAQENLFGKLTDKAQAYSQGFLSRFKENLNNNLAGLYQTFKGYISDATMLSDSVGTVAGTVGDQDDSVKYSIIGSELADNVGGLGADLAGSRVKKKLSGVDFLTELGNKLEMIGNDPYEIADALKMKYGNIPIIGDIINSMPERPDGKIDYKQNLSDTGDEPFPFTRRSDRAIVEVIPGYLSRILQQVTEINTGLPADREIFSDDKQAFTTIGDEAKRLRKDGLSRDSAYRARETDDLINAMDSKGELEASARKALAEVLLSMSADGESFNLRELASRLDKVEGGGNIAGTLANNLKGGFAEYNKLGEQYNKIAQSNVESQRNLNRIREAGNADVLRAAGYITEDKRTGKSVANMDTFNAEAASFINEKGTSTRPWWMEEEDAKRREEERGGATSRYVGLKLAQMKRKRKLKERAKRDGTYEAGAIEEQIDGIKKTVSDISDKVAKALAESIVTMRTELDNASKAALNKATGDDETYNQMVSAKDKLKESMKVDWQGVGNDILDWNPGHGGARSNDHSFLRTVNGGSGSTLPPEVSDAVRERAKRANSNSSGRPSPNISVTADNSDIVDALSNLTVKVSNINYYDSAFANVLDAIGKIRESEAAGRESKVAGNLSQGSKSIIDELRDGTKPLPIQIMEDHSAKDVDFETLINVNKAGFEGSMGLLLTIAENTAPENQIKWKRLRSLGNFLSNVTTSYFKGASRFSKAFFTGGGSFVQKTLSGLGRGTGAVINALLKRPIGDVYIEGEDDPILKAKDVADGKFFDQKSGKRIRKFKDIKGPVVNERHQVIISQEDYDRGLYERSSNRLGAVADVITSPIKASLRIGRGVVRGAVNTIKAPLGFLLGQRIHDVYVGDEKSPRLLAMVFKNKGYFSAKTKRPLRGPGNIDGDVTDSEGNVVLSLQEIAHKGIHDGNGKPVGGNRLLSLIKSMAKLTFKGAIGAGKMLFKSTTAATNLAASTVRAAGRIGAAAIGAPIAAATMPFRLGRMLKKDTLDKIYDHMVAKWPLKLSPTDRDGDGDRDGGIWDLFGKRKKKEDPIMGGKEDNPKEKKGIWATLLPLLTGIPAILKTGFTMVTKALLGKAAVNAAGDLLDGFGDGPDRRGGRGGGRRGGRGGRGGRMGGRMTLGQAARTGLGAGTRSAAVQGASTVAKVGAGQALKRGAIVAGGAVATVLGAPAVATALAIGGTAWALYEVGSWISSHISAEPLEKLRFMQYGFNPEESSHRSIVRDIEEYVIDNTEVLNGLVNISVDAMDVIEELGEDLGLDTTNVEQVRAFGAWFNERFLQVFAAHYGTLFSIDDDIDLDDVDDEIDDDQIPAYLSVVCSEGKLPSALYQIPLYLDDMIGTPGPSDIVTYSRHLFAKYRKEGVEFKNDLPPLLSGNFRAREDRSESPDRVVPTQADRSSPEYKAAAAAEKMRVEAQIATPNSPVQTTTNQKRPDISTGVPSDYVPRGQSTPVASSDSYIIPAAGSISSPFGMRRHPVTGEHKLHKGIDIAAPTGTPVKAVASGTVTSAYSNVYAGNMVTIKHDDGNVSKYMHLNSFARSAVPGMKVNQGDQIGTVGSTGRSTGPHLHLQIEEDKNGTLSAVDPLKYLERRAAVEVKDKEEKVKSQEREMSDDKSPTLEGENTFVPKSPTTAEVKAVTKVDGVAPTATKPSTGVPAPISLADAAPSNNAAVTPQPVSMPKEMVSALTALANSGAEAQATRLKIRENTDTLIDLVKQLVAKEPMAVATQPGKSTRPTGTAMPDFTPPVKDRPVNLSSS